MVGEMRRTKFFFGIHEGKCPLERPRGRWKYIINMDIEEIGWEGMDWIHLVCDRDQ
jgi:hypothetical protein